MDLTVTMGSVLSSWLRWKESMLSPRSLVTLRSSSMSTSDLQLPAPSLWLMAIKSCVKSAVKEREVESSFQFVALVLPLIALLSGFRQSTLLWSWPFSSFLASEATSEFGSLLSPTVQEHLGIFMKTVDGLHDLWTSATSSEEHKLNTLCHLSQHSNAHLCSYYHICSIYHLIIIISIYH